MNSARDLSSHLAELLRKERFAMAEFLVALAEFDRDRGWVELGYPSLFAYLHRELRLASGPAFYRMTAARLVQEYPEVIEPLRDGRLCLSTVAELSKVVTRENVTHVLPRFFGASKQDAKEISAELSPQAVPTRTVVTAIAAPAAPAAAIRQEVFAADLAPEVTGSASAVRFLPEEAPSQRSARPTGAAPTVVEPKTAELSRMHITVSRRLLELLAAARDALSHARPDATDDDLLQAGLNLLLKDAAKRRGVVDKPRQAPPQPIGDGIPAHVRRAVWERDGGRCTFPLANGGVCGSAKQVEFNHVLPKALGGPSTVANVNLRCHFHNIVEARSALGDEVMDRYTRIGRGPSAC